MATEMAPPEELKPDETLGHFLKRERSLKGVSLREVADATKISQRFLEALEADEYEAFPPRAIVVGFLRAYALCLKIDPQEVILLYEQGVRETRAISEMPRPEEGPQDDTALKRVMLLVLVGLFAASLFYIVFLRDWSPKVHKTKITTSSAMEVQRGPAERGVPRTPVGAVREAARSGESSSAVRPLAADRPMTLEVSALGETWVRVERDDGKITALLLRQGERRQWQARERFVLTIGNVTGTRLFLDGRPVTLPRSKSNTLHNVVLSRHRLLIVLP